MDWLEEKKMYSLLTYNNYDSVDVFEKCYKFSEKYDSVNESGVLSDVHRVELNSGLDAKVKLRNGKDVLCFDSNGYLGLQHHPKVKAKIIEVIDTFGAGTPSVPLLGGTNFHTRELEKKIAQFHNREDALIFTSAYTANLGIVSALARKGDIVLYDQRVHASIMEGIKLSKCKDAISFKFNDVVDLEKHLLEIKESGHDGGILVFSDGVYSMEGVVFNLPAMKEVCVKYGARLIVDECHSIGVLGKTGRGIEDYYQMNKACDLIIGCFSKALGFFGGYITGDKEVIKFLRFFSNSYIFSTSVPASICAGIKTCFDLIDEEPHWVEQLRANSNYLKEKIREIGIDVPAGESSIIKVPIDRNLILFQVGKDLLDMGLKCGVVTFPAVKDHKGLLRIVVTARHTKEDIDQAVTILKTVLTNYKLL